MNAEESKPAAKPEDKEKQDDGLAIALMRLYRDMRSRLSRTTMPDDHHTSLGTSVLYSVTVLGMPRLKELAASLHVAPPTLTPVVANLVEGGYLTRTKDSGDARAARFTMTLRGMKAYERGVSAMAAAMEEMIVKLNAKQRAELYEILGVIE